VHLVKPWHLRDGQTVRQEEGVFEIQNILAERITNGATEYLVKWRHYRNKDNEWVREDNLDAPELLQAWKARNSSAQTTSATPNTTTAAQQQTVTDEPPPNKRPERTKKKPTRLDT